MITAAFIVDI